MPGGVAYLLEVIVLAARPHALLRCGCAPVAVRRLFHPQKHFLELHHPRVREQQRRVVGGHEGGARTWRVAMPGEILEKPRANVGSAHIRAIYESARSGARRSGQLKSARSGTRRTA